MKQAFLSLKSAESEAAKLRYTKRTNVSVSKKIHPVLGDIWIVSSEFKSVNVFYKKRSKR